MSHSKNTIYSQTIKGVKWTALSQIGRQLIQFLILAFLTRLLKPADFGFVNMVVIFTGFANLFNELGLVSAIVQREEIEESHLSSIFYLNLVSGMLLGLLFWICTPLLVKFYNEPVLYTLTPAIAITFPINSLGLVQRALLQRKMNFDLVSYLEIFSIGISGFVAIVMAYLNMGVWSLVGQSILISCSSTLISWYVSDWYPKLIFSYKAVRELWQFSANLLGFQIFNYWARNSDNFLVGQYLGPTALGFYARAYSTMLLPINQVSSILTRVMFASFSRIQKDTSLIKTIYLQVVSLIAFVTFPMMIGLLVLGDKFVIIVYGENWVEIVTPLRILCVVGMSQSIATTVGWIYQSQGRTDLMFKWGTFAGVVSFSSFIVGVYFGSIESVCWSYLISNILLTYWGFAIPGRLIDLSVFSIISAVYKTLICSILMGLYIFGFTVILNFYELPIGFEFIMEIIVGVIVYVILTLLFNRSLWSLFKNIVLKTIPQSEFLLNYLPS